MEEKESRVNNTIKAIKSATTSVKNIATDASQATYEAGKSAVKTVGKVTTTTAELVGDLNGDGKVDIEDAKIAVAKAKQATSAAADEAAKLGKVVMESELVKDVAPYAAIGAAIAVPIPIVGPALGAAAGAALGLYKNATKKK